jgi:hypothetical protein
MKKPLKEGCGGFMEKEYLQLKELFTNFENLKDENKERLLRIGAHYLHERISFGNEKLVSKIDGLAFKDEKLV